MIIEYPKTQTIWKRDLDTGKIIPGDYSLEEIKNIKLWHVTEKIDGTNIRIVVRRNENGTDDITIMGRTGKSDIPEHLIQYLRTLFVIGGLAASIRKPDTPVFKDSTIILFGEGYGYKIQGGQPYRKKDVSFVLFDIWIDGWWLSQNDVTAIANKLGIDRAPIIATILSELDIIDYVKSKPFSVLAQEKRVIEGVVVRTEPLLLLRNGKRLMWKLKVKDFDNL